MCLMEVNMLISHEVLKDNLDGMYWDHGDLAPKQSPNLKNNETRAISAFKRDLPSVCFNYLRCFENVKVTLVQTEMALHGVEPFGIDKDDFLKIERFGQTASRMCELILNHEFDCSSKSLELISQCLCAKKQDAISVEHGLKFISENFSKKRELGVVAFLYLLRQKPFDCGNEISAALFMEGILISQGFEHIVIRERAINDFKIRLCEFKKSGCASHLLRFLAMSLDCNKIRHERFSKQKSKTKKPLIFF